MKKLFFAALMGASMLTFSSCKKNDDGGTTTTITAGVNGSVTTPVGSATLIGSQGSITKTGTTYLLVGGGASGTTPILVTIYLYNITATGTYNFGGPYTGGNSAMAVGTIATGATSPITYYTEAAATTTGAAGSIIITKLTSTSIEGTYTMTAKTNTSATSTITNGSFSKTF